MIIDNDIPFVSLSNKPVDLLAIEEKQRKQQEIADSKSPSFTELLGAAELSYNVTARHLTGHWLRDDPHADGEDFDPILKAANLGVDDERYLDIFKNVDNQKEFDDAMTYYKHQRQYDEVLSKGGTFETLAATLYAGALDPAVMFLPAAGLATKAKAAGGAARTIGKFIAGNAPAIAASELALAAGKPEMTVEEAAIDTLLGVGLTGAFGAAKYAIDGVKVGKIRKELEAGVPQNGIDYLDRSAGAAMNPETALTRETSEIRNNLAVGLSGEAILSPKYRMANADEVSIRDAADRLSPNPFTTEGTVKGIARPQNVWAGMQKHIGSHALFELDAKDMYGKYAKRLRDSGQKPMSRRDFLNEVGNAVIEFDVPTYRHQIEEVDALGRTFQEKYNKPLYKEAVEVGALDPSFKEKIESDPDFMHRMYDQDKINANPVEWRRVLGTAVDKMRDGQVRSLKKQMIEVEESITSAKLKTKDETRKLETEVKRLDKELEQKIKSLDEGAKADADAEIRELRGRLKEVNEQIVQARLAGEEKTSPTLLARRDEYRKLRSSMDDLIDDTKYGIYRESIVDSLNSSIKGYSKTGTGFTTKPISSGPMKDRTVPLSNKELRDFINTNILDVSYQLHKRTASDIELRKAFGTSDFNQLKETIIKEHNDLIRNVTDPKQLAKMEAKFKANLGDLGIMWDMVSGVKQLNNAQKLGMRFASGLTHWQYLTKMGFFPVSNFVDFSSAVMVHGLGRLFNQAFEELPIVGLSKEFKRMRKADLQRYGLATNYIHSEYMKSMMGMDDSFVKGGIADRVNKAVSTAFNKATLIDRFVDWEQKKIGVMTMQRLVDAANGKEKYDANKEWLANLGISKFDLDQIKTQLDKYAVTQGDATSPNFHLWDDQTLADKFGNAITTDNALILSQNYPGALPLVLENSAWGKIASQLSRYLIQASKVLTAGIVNRRDRHFVEFALTAVTLGMMSSIVSDLLKGKEIEDDMDRLLLNGVKKSGLFTALQLVDDKLLNPFDVGSEALFGVEPNYRPSSSAEAVLNIVAGPTGGTAAKLFDVAAAVRNGDFSQSSLHKLRGMLPLQNVFWLYSAMDEAEKLISEQLDLRPAKKRKRNK